jgi:hypothetical protein
MEVFLPLDASGSHNVVLHGMQGTSCLEVLTCHVEFCNILLLLHSSRLPVICLPALPPANRLFPRRDKTGCSGLSGSVV